MPEDAAQGTVEARADLEQLPGAAQERDRVLRDVGEDRGASLRRKCVREATRFDAMRRARTGGWKTLKTATTRERLTKTTNASREQITSISARRAVDTTACLACRSPIRATPTSSRRCRRSKRAKPFGDARAILRTMIGSGDRDAIDVASLLVIDHRLASRVILNRSNVAGGDETLYLVFFPLRRRRLGDVMKRMSAYLLNPTLFCVARSSFARSLVRSFARDRNLDYKMMINVRLRGGGGGGARCLPLVHALDEQTIDELGGLVLRAVSDARERDELIGVRRV